MEEQPCSYPYADPTGLLDRSTATWQQTRLDWQAGRLAPPRRPARISRPISLHCRANPLARPGTSARIAKRVDMHLQEGALAPFGGPACRSELTTFSARSGPPAPGDRPRFLENARAPRAGFGGSPNQPSRNHANAKAQLPAREGRCAPTVPFASICNKSLVVIR